MKKAYVIININLGNSEENVSDIPFTCKVSVRGIYGYDSEDFVTDESLKKF